MKTIENLTLGARFELVELLQRHVEAFFKELRALHPNQEKVSLPEDCGDIVRAAVKAGIVDVNVEEARPAVVRWLARELNTHINDSLEVPPN